MNLSKLGKMGLYATALSLAACTMPANGGNQTAGCKPGTGAGQSAAGLEQVTLCVTSGAKRGRLLSNLRRRRWSRPGE
jgi:hypothetical protein